MTAAFIVTLDLPDTLPDTLQSEADYLHDLCEQNGVPVVSVAPWQRPSHEAFAGSLVADPLDTVP